MRVEETSSTLDREYGRRLRDLREGQGLTQTDLVAQLRARGLEHMNATTLSRIESGQRPVRLSEARVLVDVFDWSLAMLTVSSADFEALELIAKAEKAVRERHDALRAAVAEFEQSKMTLRAAVSRMDEGAREEAIDSDLESDLRIVRKNIDHLLSISAEGEAAAVVAVLREQDESSAGRFFRSQGV